MGGICAITCGSSYGFNLDIWEAKVIYPSAAFCNPEAIRCNEASISVESVSHTQDLSSILEVESSGSAVMVLSSLEESEELQEHLEDYHHYKYVVYILYLVLF